MRPSHSFPLRAAATISSILLLAVIFVSDHSESASAATLASPLVQRPQRAHPQRAHASRRVWRAPHAKIRCPLATGHTLPKNGRPSLRQRATMNEDSLLVSESGKPLKAITLDSKVILSSLRFQRAMLQGKPIIIIDAVRMGSVAEAMGIKPGQILVAISDPIQGLETLWPVEEKTSLRFLMDAVRVSTGGKIKIVLEDPDPTKPAPKLESGASNTTPVSLGGGSYIGVEEAGGTLSGKDSINSRQTQRVATNVQRRIQARDEMLTTIGKRNDTPFLLTLAAALILPGLFGLAIAYVSGYQFMK